MCRKNAVLAVLAAGLVSSTLAFAGPASAQSAPPKEPQPYPVCNHPVSSADSELAHQKYIAGKTDFDEANYESAVRRFRDAYNLDCTKHELLIIISAAYERKFDRREAVAALEAYVARAPTAPDVGAYQVRIDNLKKEIAKEKPAEKPAPAEGEGQSPYPWIVVGAGAAAAVAGVVLLATTPDVPRGCVEATRTCTRQPGEPDSDYESRQSTAGRAADQPIFGFITLGVGAAAIVGGLVWFLLDRPATKEPARATTLRPLVSPTGGVAGISLGGRF